MFDLVLTQLSRLFRLGTNVMPKSDHLLASSCQFFAKKLFSVTAVKDLLKTCYNLSNISVLNDIKSF